MNSFRNELENAEVPEQYAVSFDSLTSLIYHIRDYKTEEDELFGWLAHEWNNARRKPVLERLHQRYTRLRANRERKELGV